MFDLPLTIVTGYLGSGKTSWINRRLEKANGIRYAVLVNDFGELNIDVDLIESATAKTVSLVNGCVCCSIGNDLGKALEELRLIADSIDWVLIEASGIADSVRLQNIVLNWPGFNLRDTLTLVDVTRIRRLANDKFVGQHIHRQLACASEIVLSKTDLCQSDVLKDLQRWLGTLSPQFANATPGSNPESNIHASHESQNEQQHPVFYSDSFRTTAHIYRSEMESWLRHLDEETLRVKGFVFFKEDPTLRHLIQWVDQSHEISAAIYQGEQTRQGEQAEQAETRIVLISRQATTALEELESMFND